MMLRTTPSLGATNGLRFVVPLQFIMDPLQIALIGA
jgi:hypothetical protein